MSLETGMLLLHKHGHDCMLVSPPLSAPFHQAYSKLNIVCVAAQHEGREVKAGEKWVIRTDLCVKR